jgi:hypothetical protein
MEESQPPQRTSLRDGKAGRRESKKNVTNDKIIVTEHTVDQVELDGIVAGPSLSTRAQRRGGEWTPRRKFLAGLRRTERITSSDHAKSKAPESTAGGVEHSAVIRSTSQRRNLIGRVHMGERRTPANIGRPAGLKETFKQNHPRARRPRSRFGSRKSTGVEA